MKKVLAGAIPLLAALVMAAPSQASDAQACSMMTTSTAVGNSDDGYAAPVNQATYIAVSQGSNNYFTSRSSDVLSVNANPAGCEARYEYNDAFGVYRLIKIQSTVWWFGATVVHWRMGFRGCWYRTNPAFSWTSYTC